MHEEYKSVFGQSLSLSHFWKLHPKHLLSFTKNKFEQCLCEYCVHVEMKVKILQQTARILNCSDVLSDAVFDYS